MSHANSVYILAALLFFAIGLSYGIPSALRYWKSQWSKDWPRVPGSFVDGNISVRTIGAASGSRLVDLTVWFSYTASGDRYTGCYEEIFNSEYDAQHILESLRTGPLFVRIDPRNPAKYFIDPYKDIRSQART